MTAQELKPCDGCGNPTISRCYAYVGNFNCGCPCCPNCKHDHSQKLWLTHIPRRLEQEG